MIGYKSIRDGEKRAFGTDIDDSWIEQRLMDSLVKVDYERQIAEAEEKLDYYTKNKLKEELEAEEK